jgi:hypothetical protein
MDKCAASGGYLNIIDQTTASINSFEALCNTLESIAEKRGRPADLIVVDNIDMDYMALAHLLPIIDNRF